MSCTGGGGISEKIERTVAQQIGTTTTLDASDCIGDGAVVISTYAAVADVCYITKEGAPLLFVIHLSI